MPAACACQVFKLVCLMSSHECMVTLVQFPLLSTDLGDFLPMLKSIPSISTHPVLLSLPSFTPACFLLLSPTFAAIVSATCLFLSHSLATTSSVLVPSLGTLSTTQWETHLPNCQRFQLHSQHDRELKWGMLIVSCLNARLLEAAQSCEC